jgi:hypothetical protein
MSIKETAVVGHPFARQPHDYGYDDVDRLLTATGVTPGNYTYDYDNLNNATTVTTPSATTSPNCNALNQVSTWDGDT